MGKQIVLMSGGCVRFNTGNILFIDADSSKFPAICGKCGCLEDDDNGNCKECESDNWIELADLDNPELNEYIKDACNNLSINEIQLKLILEFLQ